MNRSIRPYLFLVSALAVAGCDLNPNATGERPGDLDSVRRANSAFLSATATKNFEAMRARYASDAVMVLPNLEPMTGVKAITADYQSLSKDPAATFKASNDAVMLSASGDLAFARGTYVVTYTNPSTGKIERGRDYYVLIYRKQNNGDWKIIQDISSPLPYRAPSRP